MNTLDVAALNYIQESPAVLKASTLIILVFSSTTEVLNAEDCLEAAALDFKLVPVPKEVNPNCGLALSFTAEAGPPVCTALTRGGFRPTAIYTHQGGYFRPLPTGNNNWICPPTPPL